MSNRDAHNESPDEMSAMMETSFAARTNNPGDVVHGRIVKITGEAAFVDYGAKSEGMVNLAELRDEAGTLLHNIGAVLDFVIAENKGYVRLSFRDAQAGKARLAIREAWKKQTPVQGKIVGTNKGGYEVRIDGVRAFCPSSQLGERPVAEPQAMVGQTFEFSITEWDDTKGAVVSRRALLQAERERSREALSGRLNEGEVHQGRVTQLQTFGAFVDLGGIEGLIHISALGGARVKHPSERLSVGDAVEVIVLKVDLEKGRVALRLRGDESAVEVGAADGESDATPNPKSAFTAGQRITGTVSSLQPFGAFVNLAPRVDGLLHVSAISATKRVQSPSEVLTVGQTLEVVVESVDAQKGRIALCTPEVWDVRQAPAITFELGQIVKGRVVRIERYGAFIDIAPRISGLMPWSEADSERGARAEDMYPVGTEIEVKIVEIADVAFEGKDGKKGGMRKKIRLSRKALKGDTEAEEFREWRQKQNTESRGSGATLGDLFGNLLKR